MADRYVVTLNESGFFSLQASNLGYNSGAMIMAREKIPGYFTLRQAAEALEVCHSAVARYVRRGLLPAIDLGGQRLIKKEHIEGFEKPKVGNPNFRKRRKARRR